MTHHHNLEWPFRDQWARLAHLGHVAQADSNEYNAAFVAWVRAGMPFNVRTWILTRRNAAASLLGGGPRVAERRASDE